MRWVGSPSWVQATYSQARSLSGRWRGGGEQDSQRWENHSKELLKYHSREKLCGSGSSWPVPWEEGHAVLRRILLNCGQYFFGSHSSFVQECVRETHLHF